MEDKYWENIEGKGELSVRVITAETAAVNNRRNTAPEFPMYECPPPSALKRYVLQELPRVRSPRDDEATPSADEHQGSFQFECASICAIRRSVSVTACLSCRTKAV